MKDSFKKKANVSDQKETSMSFPLTFMIFIQFFSDETRIV